MILKMVRIHIYIFHRRLLTKCHNIFFDRYKMSQYKHLKDKKADMVKKSGCAWERDVNSQSSKGGERGNSN